MKTLAIAVTALAASGVLTGASAAPTAYRCKDGTQLTAMFHGGTNAPGSVDLSFDHGRGPTTTLPQAPSADGGRYAGKDIEFWIKGRTARLTRGAEATDCRAR